MNWGEGCEYGLWRGRFDGAGDDVIQLVEVGGFGMRNVEAVEDAAEALVAAGLGEPHPFDSRLIERLDGLGGQVVSDQQARLLRVDGLRASSGCPGP